MKIVKLGLVGLGPRAETLLASLFHMQDEVTITGVCDFKQERIEFIQDLFRKRNLPVPKGWTDYLAMLADDSVEAVVASTSWNSHLTIARDAMELGKYCGFEVGGASSLDQLWALIHAAERTGGNCMLMENDCYGRNELLAANMARKGLFGEIVYCTCGYEHNLAPRMAKMREERAVHNRFRRGDLYPTHGLGPMAKILGINRGNRFLTLTSTASKACGFAAAAKKADPESTLVFNEPDIINTCIKCANGEMITLTHGISLPRPYSRDQRLQGTKGIWLEDVGGIYIDGISRTETRIDAAGNPYDEHIWDKVSDYYEKYDHPIWKDYCRNQIGEHGGRDALTLRAFLDSVRNHTPTPIDVYDCAAWMAVTCLSEQSLAMGGVPVPFPDFTNGKWIYKTPAVRGYWSLDE